MRHNASRPARSTRAALSPENPYIEMSELREEVGLFGDTSQDALLLDYLLSATERIESLVGRPIPARGSNDYYRNAAPRVALSASGVSVDTIKVFGYLPDADAESELTGWYVDPSTDPMEIVFPETIPLSTRFNLPLRIQYDAGVTDAYPLGREQIRQALRYCVSVFFESKGTTGLPDNWERGLSSLIPFHLRAVV